MFVNNESPKGGIRKEIINQRNIEPDFIAIPVVRIFQALWCLYGCSWTSKLNWELSAFLSEQDIQFKPTSRLDRLIEVTENWSLLKRNHNITLILQYYKQEVFMEIDLWSALNLRSFIQLDQPRSCQKYRQVMYKNSGIIYQIWFFFQIWFFPNLNYVNKAEYNVVLVFIGAISHSA